MVYVLSTRCLAAWEHSIVNGQYNATQQCNVFPYAYAV